MNISSLEVGLDVPARVGMAIGDVQTPCALLDLDALERNLIKMRGLVESYGVALRVHGKMHKSADVALLQHRIGGATGICCQKVSEADAFAKGGLKNILVSNQIRDSAKINHMMQIAKRGIDLTVCIDDIDNVAELSDAAARHGVEIGALVELDCGAGRCGVTLPSDVVVIAKAINDAPGLRFQGLQAYQGAMQHFETHEKRRLASQDSITRTRAAVDALDHAGIPPKTVTGAGTGSFEFEAASGLYTELQCGSYAFMDADYGRVLDESGARLDHGMWENAFFVLTSVMSTAKPGLAVCDAGHKSHAIDSGLPTVFGRDDLTVVDCSDEHTVLSDPNDTLKINDKLRLVPGHCDPTCNLHDWFLGLRGDTVETLWPVTARGKTL